MMCIVFLKMDSEFDIDEFTKNLAGTHPELVEGLEGTSLLDDFETDEFERKIVNEYPELAEKICELDEKTVKEEQEKKVSKKQQARDRRERLEAMMIEGRSVVEKKDETYHDRILEIKGPLELLAKAVKGELRIEVRTRAVDRIDRIFEGIPTTFDEHMNVMMKNVTETIRYGRKAKKEVGSRNRVQEFLPEFLRWKEGGNWPMPIGANSLVEHRFQRSCFVKGDSIVFVRTLS
ncbi:hypothetical protein CRE_11016 [Caenorhabditis remanei]|uniref:Sm domain-containing protein n=1 Tax=Caenorhabditis remanei TaxID=31234 RepID=E3M4Z9_CAERE|nr:hypothetical protein CRE_11016 [Caenorhabditis remanei]